MNYRSQAAFGLRLKTAFKDIQNREIAEKLGISKSAVTAYLKGNMPTAGQLLKIAELTGCNLHWLLTGEGSEWFVQEPREGERSLRTLAIINPLGGSGKSTAASFLALTLVRQGARVLVFDTPNQSCAMHFVGEADPLAALPGRRNSPKIRRGREGNARGCAELERLGTEHTIFLHASLHGLDLCVPTGDDSSLERGGAKRFQLRPEHIPDEYDYLIFDSLPGVDPFYSQPSFASDYLKSPQILLSWLERPGLSRIDNILRYIRDPDLPLSNSTLIGVFMNNVQRLPAALIAPGKKALRQSLPGEMMRTEISYSSAFQESLFNGSTIQNLGPTSKIVTDYSRLADEVLSVLDSQRPLVVGQSGS